MTSNVDRNRAARLDVEVTRQIFVPGRVEDVSDFVAAEDVLPKILTGYALVPGVASTSDISGPWDQPGSHLIVHLLDGSTVNEGITAYNRPSYFAYRVSNPSFALKHLMAERAGSSGLRRRRGNERDLDLHLPGEEPTRQTSADAVREDAMEGVHGRLSEKYLRCHDASMTHVSVDARCDVVGIVAVTGSFPLPHPDMSEKADLSLRLHVGRVRSIPGG
jgi:hypothetical protein